MISRILTMISRVRSRRELVIIYPDPSPRSFQVFGASASEVITWIHQMWPTKTSREIATPKAKPSLEKPSSNPRSTWRGKEKNIWTLVVVRLVRLVFPKLKVGLSRFDWFDSRLEIWSFNFVIMIVDVCVRMKKNCRKQFKKSRINLSREIPRWGPGRNS